jgi:DNA-binding response OmpR family regulator
MLSRSRAAAIQPLDVAAHVLVSSRRVLVRGDERQLTRLEFDLLLFLCKTPGRVHTRAAIMAGVWQTTTGLGGRTVDVHVLRLRRKLDPVCRLIHTD